ncbi:mannose-1-phosphate guanylyltransferase [Kordiimonas sediminis]|uniref:Mannose-1-phosphate guanylyltransferase n=1 Tax=Kordiimonas sediminis TaxID=1735581 RepID=A0A919ANP4_9PROT|nr:nucleotidyltransferase family protein [Kordiimonas sediminis]GHF16692.1 mannose-1-phosphate guanylyltransferase [Kordiimonas sediminis]
MIDIPQKAMVLAAGKGTRMGDLSLRTPKPLVSVAGRSLLDRILDHLAPHGIHAIVNVHHLADQIEAHLQAHIGRGAATVSDERAALLETGGGVKKALPHLGTGPFYVINSDALWCDASPEGGALSRLGKAFDPATMDVLLLLVPTEKATGYDGAGDFFPSVDFQEPDDTRTLSFHGERPSAPFMYGGIMITHPGMYRDQPAGAWSNIEIFRQASKQGRLFGLVHTGHWMHVGTQEGIQSAEYILQQLEEKILPSDVARLASAEQKT